MVVTLINSQLWHFWVHTLCTILFACTVIWAFWFASQMD
ncbi:MAG: delta-aminolevulinic acid dehydratase [Spirulinaceae cyanobacterium RM2_2_10]|nr:delta-aminolevulinic acid dehydratase [Spirulinaceae cyanobacterium SM2_1_0]NJO21552.1 delta-aminolevulinic acid dehydratase [Spirulinaceae cyanobacterium RM2_2_10]